MKHSEAITSLAQRLGLTDIPQDQDGRYGLLLDGQFTLYLIPKPAQQFLLVGLILEKEEQASFSEEFLKKLLRLNLQRIQPWQDVLTLNPEGGTLILERIINLNLLQPEAFLESIQSFVNNLEWWVHQARRSQEEKKEIETPGVMRMIFP